MNTTPQGERLRIVFIGPCNAGKSSLINAITEENVSIVSPQEGTTTDPVKKAMELLPLGPILLVDTAGIDDTTPLGIARKKRTEEELARADLVVIVNDARTQNPYTPNFPQTIHVYTHADLTANRPHEGIYLSSVTHEGIENLKSAIINALSTRTPEPHLVSDLVPKGSIVLLVVPIDSSAPKGRLILPQQQVIRDLLDSDCIPVITRDTTLKQTLETITPALVITDSQAFKTARTLTPKTIPLTSFSILFARYKGDIKTFLDAAKTIPTLQDGDKILIAEGCTHHQQDDDIGTVKIPKGLTKFTGKNLIFHHANGLDFPKNITDYKLIIHCGGCMLNRREILNRIKTAKAHHIPIINYGILLALISGILNEVEIPC